jgi:hypothetical protein
VSNCPARQLWEAPIVRVFYALTAMMWLIKPLFLVGCSGLGRAQVDVFSTYQNPADPYDYCSMIGDVHEIHLINDSLTKPGLG